MTERTYGAETQTSGSSTSASGQKLQEQGKKIAGEAESRAKGVASGQKGKAAEGIGTVAQALRDVSRNLEGHEQKAIASYASSAADRLEDASRYLRNHSVDELMDEAQHLVQRNPALFIGGAFAAGLILSRFLKSSKSGYAHSAQTGTTASPISATSTTTQ